MSSVNKVILIGNLGRDPEMRYLPSGSAVASLAIATTDKYKDKTGNMVEATEWHRVSFFDRTAEVCGQYLKKGSQVYIEGSLKTRKYTDKDGVEKYATEIRGDRMQMLGGKGDSDKGHAEPEQRTERARAPESSGAGNGFDDMDNDLPFVTASPAFDGVTPMRKRLRRYGREVML